MLEAEKRGPALENGCGDAEMHRGQHDRESLRAADGLQRFRG